ncbi:rod-binding protein [Vibrio sp. HA2012]|uniref:rod-binding protein n=1 Tax=Vibrio sp. HA2012 TaxID=1971595 RepID=UPI003FCD30D7
MNAVLYHDNSALTTVKYNQNQEDNLEVVAGQFEAMFLQMVLQQMRSASDVLSADDSPFSSKEQGVYRDFYDGQMAIELAGKQRGGIADMLVKQLSPAQYQAVAQMVEPANEVMTVTEVSNRQQKEMRLNNEMLSDALYPETPLAERPDWAGPLSECVAFQQPLLRNMETEPL